MKIYHNLNHEHKWKDTCAFYYTTPMLRRQECACGESRYIEVTDSGIPVIKLTEEELFDKIRKKEN